MKLTKIVIHLLLILMFFPILILSKYNISHWSYEGKNERAEIKNSNVDIRVLGKVYKFSWGEIGNLPIGVFKKIAVLPIKTSILNEVIVDSCYNSFINSIQLTNKNVEILKDYKDNYKVLTSRSLDKSFEFLSYISNDEQNSALSDMYFKIINELHADCIMFIDYNSFEYIIPAVQSQSIEDITLTSYIYVRIIGVSNNKLINYTKGFSLNSNYSGFGDADFDALKKKLFNNHLNLFFDLMMNKYSEQIF